MAAAPFTSASGWESRLGESESRMRQLGFLSPLVMPAAHPHGQACPWRSAERYRARIKELENRNERLERALEAIRLEARKSGLMVGRLRRAIALAVVEVWRTSRQEI